MDKGYSPSQTPRTRLKAESTNYCRLLRCWVWRTKGSRPHLAGRPVAWWRPVPPVAGGCPSLATTVCPWLTHRHRHLLGRTDADVGISDEAKTLRTVAPGASEVLPSNHNGKKPAASRRFSKPRNSKLQKDNHILMDWTHTTSFAEVQKIYYEKNRSGCWFISNNNKGRVVECPFFHVRTVFGDKDPSIGKTWQSWATKRQSHLDGQNNSKFW